MADSATLQNMIKAPVSKIVRRFYVKRRQLSDGLFESTWQDLTRFVIRWGNFRVSVDTPRFGDLRLDNANLNVLNIEGTFNPNDNTDSFWSGYGDIQRSLVKIEAAFVHQTLSAGGIWTNTELPTNTTMWVGIISGNIFLNGKAEVNLPLRPISQVFRDFSATDLTGLAAGGVSSGGFMAVLRDMTDGSGNYSFRPFVGTGGANDWNIETGSGILYANLDSNSAEDLHNLDCWKVVERLSRTENKFAYFNRSGQFVWQSKSATSAVQFEFHGLGTNNRSYGHTIKEILYYGKRLTSFFSRVAVKFQEENTSTSFVNTALPFTVSGDSTAWNLGNRTYDVEAFWLANSAAAASVASQIFSEVTSQDEEISFKTSFIPQLNLMDRVSISYDATDFVNNSSFWDVNDWADSAGANTVDDLIWDSGRGDAIILNSTNFKLLSININLDRLETTFIARQLN